MRPRMQVDADILFCAKRHRKQYLFALSHKGLGVANGV